MRFLVTGGAGFLGAALANRLVADGHTVQVLDLSLIHISEPTRPY